MTAAKPKLRWFQFSLRSLLVFVTLCAFLCSWLAVKMQQGEREHEMAVISELGGFLKWSQPSGLWRSLLNDEFGNTCSVHFHSGKVTDVALEHLQGLSQLRWLDLSYSEITDGEIERLKELSQLQMLTLQNTKVTDAGVKRLQQALPNCEIYR